MLRTFKGDTRGVRRWMVALLALSMCLAEESLAAPKEYSPTPRSLGWQKSYGYDESDVIAFELGAGGLWVPVVTANVDGHTLRLILDTGTRGFASLTPEVIEELGLEKVGTTRFLDAAGRDHGEIPLVLLPSLELGPLRLRNLRVIGAGPAAVQGARAGLQGTIGWHAFSEGRMTIDYSNRRAAFSKSSLPAGISSCPGRWVTRFESPEGMAGLPIVTATVAGRLVGAEIDTGKSATLLSPKLNESSKDGGRLDWRFHLGPFPVATSFARVGGGFEGLEKGLSAPLLLGVGTDILTGFLVTVDYPSQALVLEKEACSTGGK